MTDARRRSVLWGAVILYALGAAVALMANGSDPPNRALLLWAALCALGEAMWVRLPLGNATLSMAITFNFAAMLLLPAGHAMAAIGLATVVGEAVFMRKTPMRFVFNAAQSVLAAGAGITVWRALGGHTPAGVFGFSALPKCA